MNLLLALDALVEHASVQRAAEQLHLTPPAVSRALGRLRVVTGDALLVRDGRCMTPTPRALELREEVHDLVRRARAVLAPVGTLDLAGLRRCFVVHGNEDLLTLAAPGLVAAAGEQAPGVSLRLLVEESGDSDELARGRADVEVGGPLPTGGDVAGQVGGQVHGQGGAAISSTRVGFDQLVLAVGAAHPLARGGLGQGESGLEALAGAAHVSVSRRGRLHGPLDAQLASVGLHRRVVASVPSTAVALAVVRTGAAVAVVPRRLVLEGSGVVILDLPLQMAALPVVVRWHRRHDGDPAHAWLRELVATVLGRALGG